MARIGQALRSKKDSDGSKCSGCSGAIDAHRSLQEGIPPSIDAPLKGRSTYPAATMDTMANHQGNRAILLVVVAVLLLGAGALWWLDREPGAAIEGVERSSTGVAIAQTPASAVVTPRPASAVPTERSELTAAAAQVESLPASVAAALCGFRGRLVLPTGEPVPDAEVRMLRFDLEVMNLEALMPPPGALAEPRIDMSDTKTDDEGRFLLTGVWPRAVYVLNAGEGADLLGAAPLWQLVQRTPGPGEVVDLGDLVLKAAGRLVGTVVDDQGEPMAGARVRSADIPGDLLALAPLERFHPKGAVIVRDGGAGMVIPMPAWVAQRYEDLPIPTTFTDAEGAFELNGVVPGDNVVAVTADGFLAYIDPRVRVEAGETRDLGELELDIGDLIEGRVVDGQNEPIAGAEVLLAPATATIPVDFAAPAVKADAEGRFSQTGLASRQITAAARRNAGDAWLVQESQFVSRELVITLPSAHELIVRLVSRPGLEITTPRLRLLQAPPNAPAQAAVEMARLGFSQELDLEGRVRTLEDGRLAVKELARGSYVLLATSPGHAVAGALFDVEADLEQTLTLDAERPFLVRVVDTAGAPIEGASVLGEPRGRGEYMNHGPVLCGRTSADGTVRVTQVFADRVRVTARHPAYGSVREDATHPVGELQLVMEEPGALDGLLTEAGQPPFPGKWMVIITSRSGQMEMPSFATPALDGSFRVEGLQPGTYVLTVQESMSAVGSPGGLIGFAQNAFMSGFDMLSETFEIHSGQRTVVAIDPTLKAQITGPSANVSGRVMVDGRPGVGMRIEGWSNGGEDGWRTMRAEVDAAGRFDLGLVHAGQVNLSLKPGTSERRSILFERSNDLWSENFQLEDGQDREFEIELATGSVSGQVRDADGNLVAACRIRLRTMERRRSSSADTLTDESGRFSIDTLPEGTYVLEAEERRGGKAVVGGIVVVANSSTPPVQVRLRPTYTVRGTVDLAPFGGTKPEWMWLSVTSQAEGEFEGGPMSEGAQVRANGSFELEGMLPGTYTGRIYGNMNGNWEIQTPITVRSSDVMDLVLIPVKIEPPQPQAVPASAGN